jgi:cytochrome oxidase Cu insertion factor (SCO1/SenC/PrrC family)
MRLENKLLEQHQASTSDSEKQQQKKGRLFLLAMVVFFAAPIVLVMAMYRFDWHPKGQSYGDLIEPVVPIKLTEAFQDVKTTDTTVLSKMLWHDKWSAIIIADQCELTCQTRLHDARQIHASLEKDMKRLQRVLITHQQDLGDLQKKYPDLIILNQPSADIAALAQQFDMNGVSAYASERVYMVDPLGNLMLSYSNKVKPVEMRKDWARLLKYSWAG